MSDSSLLELLSVTDKAVKALNKSHSSGSSKSSVVSVKSDRSHTKDSGIRTQTENVDDPLIVDDKHDPHTSDISDISTTASDVLIRSTIVENEEKHSSSSVGGANGSNESKCSRTSIGVDNFNSSGPQKVKISTKKLREIKSPIEGDLVSPRSNTSSPPLIQQSNGHSKVLPNVRQNTIVTKHFKENSQNKKISPRDALPHKHSNFHEKQVEHKSSFPSAIHGKLQSVDEFASNKTEDPSYDKPSLGVKLQNGSLQSDEEAEPSGYKKGTVFSDKGSIDDREIIIERHTPKITRPTKQRLVDDNEDLKIKRKQMEFEESVDLIPQKDTAVISDKPENSICNSSGSMEIVTVPERIVTVSARTSLSTEISYSEEEGERIPPRLMSKFQPAPKFSSHLLRQGAPVEGTELQDRQKQTTDVQISQFSLSDRQKIKESLAKRHEHAGPIKRVVQPKLVSYKNTEPTKTTEPTTNQQVDTVTASVAASVAVAATAPFLKAQQELEARMKDMLEKVAELQNGKQRPLTVEDERVRELERQVASLTEQRIQHLEKLQEHQVAMQAKLLSMTRSAPKRRAASPETPIHSPPMHRRPGVNKDGPKKAFSKTTIHRPKSTSPSRSDYSKLMRDDPCESPFDTPNPRSKAPQPVAYNTSVMDTTDTARSQFNANNRDRGILEEILASSESPRQKSPSPQPQIHRSAYDVNLTKSPMIRKAEKLAHDLSGINDDVKSVVSEIDRRKALEEKKKQIDQKKEELLGPSPLDAYLLSSSSSKNFTTPYKSVPELTAHHFNAPLLPGFTEAEQVLHDATKTRAYLEANLQTVLRSRQESEVYTLLENLYHDSSNPERAHLQQKVDKWVSKITQQVEREITDDVVIAELQKGHLPVYKIPPPPTVITQVSKGVGRGRGMPTKVDPSVGKPRPGARIDTGLGKRLGGKENKPDLVKPTQRKTRAPFEDEEYMTRVYGKASYQGKRTTSKDPYLHFRNEPKQKPDRPPGTQETKGQPVKSARTQTSAGIKQFYFSPTHGTYIPINTTAPVPGKLIQMAVPLGGPRMEGGLTAPVTMTTAGGPVTSTPVSRPQVTAGKNVTILSIPAEESLIDQKPAPELSKQEGDITEVSEVEYDDDFSPESAPGMELPGYQPPSPPPNREPISSFPPNIPGQDRIIAASDVIAEDIRRREMIENNAVEWVEQELMARIISQMATQRKIEPPQISHFVDEVEESVSSDHENSMFLMEALGHTGLQLFIDAGQPVDSTLVNSLVKECLLEKVVSMLGQKPDDDRIGITQARTDTKMAAAGIREQEEIGYVREDEFGQRQIRTPQPTPKSSPVMSPVRMKSPPLTPPASPPLGQEVPVTIHKQPVMIQAEYDSEISESIDISEEIRQLQGKLARPGEQMLTHEVHDVVTPVPTPVPEEVVKEERAVTPPPPTPRQELIVPKVQPQVIDVPKESPKVPKVEPVVTEPEVTATSPLPWGNPDSPLPEENPDYQEEYLDHPEPIVLSAAPADDMMSTQPVSVHPRSPSPKARSPTPERQPSPVPSDDSTSLQSSISDTINQSVSMGQWLLSKSEGEVADYIVDDDLRQRIAKSSKHKGDHSVADTLRETSELVDESIEPVSEGEFQYRTNLSPEKDPVLNFIASLQSTPQLKQGQFEMPANQVYDVLNQTGKSLGEVTMVRSHGEIRYGDGEIYRDRYGHSPSRRSQERGRSSPGYVPQERESRSPTYRDRSSRSPTYRERESRSPIYGERDSRSPIYGERESRSPTYGTRESRSPTYRERENRSPTQRERGNRSPTQRSTNGRRTKSPSQRQSQEYYSNGLSPQGTRQSFNSEFSTQESMRASDLKRSSVEFNDTPQILSSSRQKGKGMTPITVTPGGLMAGGRSPLKSAMRKPPNVQRSSGQPDRSNSKNQHQAVNVRSSDYDLNNSLEGTQNLYGFNSTNEQRSSRAYTPDQMNLDALVQSGYLTQSLTYSADLGQSGNISQSMERSSYKDSLEYRQMSPSRTQKGQSLGLTYSFEDEDDFKQTGDFEGSGTLKMSVTLPTTGDSNEGSELSEIDILDGNTQ